MCSGISLSWRDVPDALIKRHGLHDRICTRSEGADREIQFLRRHRKPLVPAWRDSQLNIYPWGHHLRAESLADGFLADDAMEVVIPASMGVDKGVWFQIREGLKGVFVRGRVHMLTKPASHYYRIMTRSRRMPVFIGNDY